MTSKCGSLRFEGFVWDAWSGARPEGAALAKQHAVANVGSCFRKQNPIRFRVSLLLS